MNVTPRTVLAALLLGALASARCTAEPAAVPVEDIATAVAATMAAIGSTTEPAAVPPTSEAHALPTEASTAPPPGLIVAYTDGGNVAVLAGAGPAVPVTVAGAVEQVRLSDDGQKVAYTRRPVVGAPVELHLVNADGTGEVLLLSPADLDALYPLDGALHHDVYQFDFLPGTHVLLLNTRSIFEGPGLATHNDLIRIDGDTLARTMLLAPGKGGAFTASPDGTYLAIVRPDIIEITNSDGTPTGSGVITYAPVITYSEYAYYAQPVWSPDSGRIGVAIPSPDPLSPPLSGEVWQLPVGGTASSSGTISGQFFLFGGGDEPLTSPDLGRVSFTRATATPNVYTLHIAAIDGTGEMLVSTGDVVWEGWAPDSTHFVFAQGGPFSLQLGDTGGAVAPLVSGTDLKWFDPDEFLYLSGAMGAWTLMRAGLGLPSSPLASPAGDFVAYDFAVP